MELPLPWGPPAILLVTVRPVGQFQELTVDYCPDKSPQQMLALYKKNQAVGHFFISQVAAAAAVCERGS